MHAFVVRKVPGEMDIIQWHPGPSRMGPGYHQQNLILHVGRDWVQGWMIAKSFGND